LAGFYHDAFAEKNFLLPQIFCREQCRQFLLGAVMGWLITPLTLILNVPPNKTNCFDFLINISIK